MKNHLKAIFIGVTAMLLTIFQAGKVLAQDLGGNVVNQVATSADLYGNNKLQGVALANTGLVDIIKTAVNWGLGFLTLILLLLIMYAGWLWMTAVGDVDKVAKAKKIITGGVIGLVLMIASYTIASFAINAIWGITGSNNNDVVVGESCQESNTIRSCYNGCGVQICSNGSWTGSCNQCPPTVCPNPLDTYDIRCLDHCNNHLQDADKGETGVDCGGPCGLCPGADCSQTSADGQKTCSGTNNLCASKICLTESCKCSGVPVISEISPSDGAVGNFVYLSGYSFGQRSGQILFENKSNSNIRGLADLNLPTQCGNTWDNYKVVFKVPNLAQGDYNVYLYTAAEYGGVVSRPISFTINNHNRPGVCLSAPVNGVYNATTTIYGIGYGNGSDRSIVWGVRQWNALTDETSNKATSTYATDWKNGNGTTIADEVVDTFPENRWGLTPIQVFDGSEYSNKYYVLVSAGREGDSCGKRDFASADGCSAASVCQSGLACGYEDCICHRSASCVYGSTEQCVISGCAGVRSCQNNSTWGSCTPVNVSCVSSNLFKQASQSIYGYSFSVILNQTLLNCGNNYLGDNEVCDKVNGIDSFHTVNSIDYSKCSAYNLKPKIGATKEVICSNQCQLVLDNCQNTNASSTLPRATQSIYGWSFVVSQDGGLSAPKVIEDCNRNLNCVGEGQAPSPSPWWEGSNVAIGWSTTTKPLAVQEQEACINSVITARFDKPMMASSTLWNDGVIVLQCDNQSGDNCARASGEINQDYEKDNFYYGFSFKPTKNLDSDVWYKVILTTDLRSVFNVPLAVNNDILSNRECTGVDYESNTKATAAYCWNFKTRVSTKLCSIGCLDCYPGTSVMRWPLAEKEYGATADSKDNACLIIDTSKNNFDWNENQASDETSTTTDWYQANSLSANVATSAKVYLTAISGNPDDIFNSGKNYGRGTSTATSTALLETASSTEATIFDEQKAVRFAKIISKDVQSQKEGICKIHNNFTDLVVIEQENCSSLTNQSPSPWINLGLVKNNNDSTCLNAAISARFNLPVYLPSLTDNIEIDSLKDGQWITRTSDFDVAWGQYSLVSNTRLEMFVLEKDLALPTYLLVTPKNNNKLASETTYRVTIKGGEMGIRGAKIIVDANGNSTSTKGGKLFNDSSIGSWNHGQENYTWMFRTGTEICKVDSISVNPASKFMFYPNETQDYSALPRHQCQILNPDLYAWDWRSLVAMNDGKDSRTGDRVALIAGNPLTNSSRAIATPVAEGKTNIAAYADNQVGSGELQIGVGEFRVDTYAPVKPYYKNRFIDMSFSIDANKSSINSNSIKVFKCASGDDACSLGLASLVNTTLASSSVISGLSTYVKKLTFNVDADFVTSTKYRAVVYGGNDGIRSWKIVRSDGSIYGNKELSGLNFSTTGGGAGEQCEPNVYPWNKTAYADYCDIGTCLLNSEKNLCNTEFQQCTNMYPGTTTRNMALEPYCSDSCHNLGNINKASCGDKVVNILTEECDRGLDNGQENSPCSSNCLLNGSNQAYGSLCGNGIIETGENCDDGNINNNDGCSNKCLKESGRPNGSMRNVPVCGNGNVEFGEDCDEGAKNSATGSGCSDKCLSTGSILGQAFCGNGIVQKKAFDSFSWLIQPTDQLPIDVNTSRCPNSIWQVTLKQEMASSTVYICQQKNQLASDGNIWQRIWSGVKYFFSSLVPKARANTGNVVDACGEGYTLMASNAVVEANSFAEIIQNRYGADGIRYTYIKQGDWQMNSNYKIVVYSANNPFAKASSTPDYVTTVGPIYNNYNQCRIVDVRADIWPLGESKNRDTFFCYGDNCGKATESLYDDDMNASWNISHYPFVSSVPNNAPGNQHLYFAFAQNSKGDLLKSNVSWNLSNPSRVNLAELNMGGLPYGNTWVTAKQEPGYTQLVVNVDGGSRDNEPIGLASTTVMIQVFPCTYPWPSPEQFPFIDNGSNCKNTNASCLNTNFETYYCLGDNRVDGLLPGLATSTILSRLDGSVGNDILKEFLFYRDDIVGTSTTKFGVATSTNADAVGIRVINNASHLDPVSWYGGYFPTTKQGNPVSVNIDGYRGIIDGRTFYVSAADLDYAENGVKKIYSDIYLMSYNADADAVTQNIYRQLFNNMRFNSATSSDPDFKNGGLIFKLGTCSSDVNYDCLLDSDCLSVGKGYCLSDKAKLTRDTARLADINKVSSTLAVYYSIKRCGNELNRLCSDSSQCFGSGVCGNYYPDIKSGSYVAGCSVSTWPSWQGTLGNVLGGNLPVDPINKMFGCDTLNGFDANTCWNEQSKQVQHFIVNNTTSTVYYYMASTTNYQLSAKNEFDYGVGVNPWSWWKKINTNNVSDVFGGFNITSMCAINRCNTVDAVNDCSCPQYKASGKTCGSNKTCVLDSGDGKYKCSCIDADGDGYPDVSCNNILQVNPLINSGVQNFIPMQNNFNLGTPINSLNQNPIQGPIMGPIQ